MIHTNIFLLFLFILNIWLMYAGSVEDKINGRKAPWLIAHKASWAIRDWIIEFNHVFWLPEMIDVFKWGIVPIDLYMILVYWKLHEWGYGSDNVLHYRMNDTKPSWYIWRAWQLLPGAIVGMLALWARLQWLV